MRNNRINFILIRLLSLHSHAYTKILSTMRKICLSKFPFNEGTNTFATRCTYNSFDGVSRGVIASEVAETTGTS